MKFSDRKPDILLALGNRADLDTAPAPSRLDKWMRDAYLSIGMKYSFSEMEISIQTNAVQNIDSIDYPADCRVLKALTFYKSDGSAIPVEIKNIAYVRKYPTTNIPGVTNTPPLGPPSIAAPFGDKIYIRPVPDQNYTGFLDYWQKPQIAAAIADTDILLPDDWMELLDYFTQLRAFHALRQTEVAQQIQQLLYGYRTDQNRMVPGLIAEAETRRQQQAKWMDYGIQPRMTSGYTAGSK